MATPASDSWPGYAEGRFYETNVDLARAVRRSVRARGWPEAGPLSGPRTVVEAPKSTLLAVEVRSEADGAWVLLRSRQLRLAPAFDLFSAGAVGRVFGALEVDHLAGAQATRRAFLGLDATEWPAELEPLAATPPRSTGMPGPKGVARVEQRARFYLSIGLYAFMALFFVVAILTYPSFDAAAKLKGVALALAAFAAPWVWLARYAPRQARRNVALLDGSARGALPNAEALRFEVGGLAPDPELERAAITWLPPGRFGRDLLRRGLRSFVGNWMLAALVMLPCYFLVWPLVHGFWAVFALDLDPDSVGGTFAAAARVLLGGLLATLVGPPLLAGVLALKRREELRGATVTNLGLIARTLPRLPRYFLAQACVVAGVLAIVLFVWLGILVPLWIGWSWLMKLAVPLAIVGGSVAGAWWLGATALAGPVAVLESGTASIARSRALQRGNVWNTTGVLLVVWVVVTVLLILLQFATDFLLYENSLVRWLGPTVLGALEAVLRTAPEPLFGLALAQIYFNQRCAKESLDLELARAPVATPEASAAVLRPALRWAAIGLVIAGAIAASRARRVEVVSSDLRSVGGSGGGSPFDFDLGIEQPPSIYEMMLRAELDAMDGR